MRTIYYNGVVYTGSLPLQQAFSVENSRFIQVGSNEDANSWQGDERIDLEGAFVCAGFNDSHMHLLNYGQALSVAPLYRNTGSLENVISNLKQTAPGRGDWIIGRGWNQDYFINDKRMPNRHDLDQVSLTHPVCAIRACGHALAVNSKALEILGISDKTQSPAGGEIVMENGIPNGLFFDNAMDLVLKKIPVPDKEDIKEMIRMGCRALNTYGITSCQSDDYCVFQAMPWQTVNEAFQELEAAGELTVRVYEQANITAVDTLREFLSSGCNTGCGSDLFRIGPLKLLGDGALGARTAYLSRPYADDPDTFGLSVFTKEEFESLIGLAHKSGMQVAVHCIGDACLDLVLDSYEQALKEVPRENHRHGIVHCQITRPDQLKRMAAMNLNIYCQSIFLDYDIHIVESRVGRELAASSYSWKCLNDHGCTVSNGSDCPVELPDVMGGIQCSVTRQDLRAKHDPYLKKEAFTVQQALDSFTKAGAYASFEEEKKGCIATGMLADFVVLQDNPFEADPYKLKDIPILRTYLGGKPVYSK